jgi:LPS-assembly protein
VVEARATYENVSGVNNFSDTIRFDQTDIISNTNQLQLSLTNRIYKKDSKGNVSEIFSWQVMQDRYFDPTFGGAVLPGQRNVVLASEEITPFAFLDGPRSYSPIFSTVRLSPISFLSFDWTTDYDPLRHAFTDSNNNVNFRTPKYFVSVGQTSISQLYSVIPGQTARVAGLLTPSADQIRFSAGIGNPNRRGLNFAISDDYDFQQQTLLYQMAQVAYNTDCCGFSMQFRRFALGTRNENQFLFSFAIANIGTFGSLQKQERIF